MYTYLTYLNASKRVKVTIYFVAAIVQMITNWCGVNVVGCLKESGLCWHRITHIYLLANLVHQFILFSSYIYRKYNRVKMGAAAGIITYVNKVESNCHYLFNDNLVYIKLMIKRRT